MTSQSQGIQQLLQAEKRAKDKVEEAKKKLSRCRNQQQETMLSYRTQLKCIKVMSSGGECDKGMYFVFQRGIEGKGKRLKQAKEEAIAEVDHYRLQREKEFRNKQTNVMGSQGNLSAKIEEQTTETIRNLTSSYHKNMESMMKKLLNTICDIKPEVHPNFRHAV